MGTHGQQALPSLFLKVPVPPSPPGAIWENPVTELAGFSRSGGRKMVSCFELQSLTSDIFVTFDGKVVRFPTPARINFKF